jgi:hypothetical protein
MPAFFAFARRRNAETVPGHIILETNNFFYLVHQKITSGNRYRDITQGKETEHPLPKKYTIKGKSLPV